MLVDIKRTKADKAAQKKEWESGPGDGDDYPYGLVLRLDDMTIKKLKLGDVDAEEPVRIHAEAFVSDDEVRKRNGKTVRSMSLQITKLALVPGEKDDAKADSLYGKAK